MGVACGCRTWPAVANKRPSGENCASTTGAAACSSHRRFQSVTVFWPGRVFSSQSVTESSLPVRRISPVSGGPGGTCRCWRVCVASERGQFGSVGAADAPLLLATCQSASMRASVPHTRARDSIQTRTAAQRALCDVPTQGVHGPQRVCKRRQLPAFQRRGMSRSRTHPAGTALSGVGKDENLTPERSGDLCRSAWCVRGTAPVEAG